MSQSISSQVQSSGLAGGLTSTTPPVSIFNPAPTKPRVPGNETPIFIAVWGGRNGRQPVLRLVDHTKARFNVNGTFSHCVDLAIPNTTNIRTMSAEADSLIRAVRAQHDIFEKSQTPNWQDWNPEKIDSAMDVFNRFALKYGCTTLAATQQPYRARGESRSTTSPSSSDDSSAMMDPFSTSNLG